MDKLKKFWTLIWEDESFTKLKSSIDRTHEIMQETTNKMKEMMVFIEVLVKRNTDLEEEVKILTERAELAEGALSRINIGTNPI